MRDVRVAPSISVWALLLSSGAVLAQELPGDPVAGQDLANEVCAVCHVVSASQQNDPGVGAPSFLTVAEHASITETSLRAFLQTPHATMPNLMLTPEETDDIISYLLTLKGQ